MLTLRVLPSWLQNLSFAFTRKQTAELPFASVYSEPKAKTVPATAVVATGEPKTILLRLYGVIDQHTYQEVLAVAATAYANGVRSLLIDLHEVSGLELSGLFALHNIARLFAGASLLDPECGWRGMRMAAEELPPEMGRRVKVVQPSPVVHRVLAQSSFCRSLEICPDMATALATLPAAE